MYKISISSIGFTIRRIVRLAKLLPVCHGLKFSLFPLSSYDRMEDLTDPEKIRQDPKCDRTVSLYGYLRGTYLKNKGQVHIPGEQLVLGLPQPSTLDTHRRTSACCAAPQVSGTSRWQTWTSCPTPAPCQTLRRRGPSMRRSACSTHQCPGWAASCTTRMPSTSTFPPTMSNSSRCVCVCNLIHIFQTEKLNLATSMVQVGLSLLFFFCLMQDEVRPTTELVQSLIDTHATLDAKMAASKMSLFSGSASLDPDDFEEQNRWEETRLSITGHCATTKTFSTHLYIDHDESTHRWLDSVLSFCTTSVVCLYIFYIKYQFNPISKFWLKKRMNKVLQ